LLEEAVLGFEAESGAVYLARSGGATPVHATRGWKGEAALNVSLKPAANREPLGVLVLGARRDGAEYSTRDRSTLEEAAQIVALAIAEDQKESVPARKTMRTRRRTRQPQQHQR
jgi:hypothetical protein